MSIKRKKKASNTKKNKNTLQRLGQCAQRTAGHQQLHLDQRAHSNPQQKLTVKDVENIILDLALAATYNHGDKKDVMFVQDILQPNNINIPSGAAMETFWDKITNSGLVKPSIGFGNNDKITITPQGYELMEQFGSYQSFLTAQQQEAALKQQLMQNAANPNSNSVVVLNEQKKEVQAVPIPNKEAPLDPAPQKIPKPALPPTDPKEKPEDNNLNFE